MNQELAEFFIKFTAKGFEEVKKDIDDLSKKMDEVGDASEKASEKHKTFMGSIGSWIISLGLLSTAVWGLKKAWEGVSEVSQKVMDLNWASLYTGASAETLERWQNVAHRSALPIQSIVPSFDALYKFLWEYSNAKIPGEEFNEKIGLALQGTTGGAEIQKAIMDSIEAGNANALLEVLNKYISSGALGSQASRSILSAFGIDNETMMGLLAQSNLAESLAKVPANKSKKESMRNSAEFSLARAQLSEAVEEFWLSIQPEVTKLVKWFTNTALPDIRALITNYWPQIEASFKSLMEWLIKKAEWFIDKFGTKEEKASLKERLQSAVAVGATTATIGAVGGGLIGAGAGAVGGGIIGFIYPDYLKGEEKLAKTRQSRKDLEAWVALDEQIRQSLYENALTYGTDYWIDALGTSHQIPMALEASKRELASARASATANILVNGNEVSRADGSTANADYILNPQFVWE